jgi:hypothetical protein
MTHLAPVFERIIKKAAIVRIFAGDARESGQLAGFPKWLRLVRCEESL